MPVMSTYDLVLVSRQLGCVAYDAVYGVDLARLCPS